MEQSLYHILLRTSALTLSLVLLFVSGVFSPVTQQLSQDTGMYLASTIGIQASVPVTEINTLSAQLEQRNVELSQREVAVTLKENESSTDTTTFILSVVLFVLLVLIILNYVLDFMRGREVRKTPQTYEQVA